jgi:hypothetical protein
MNNLIAVFRGEAEEQRVGYFSGEDALENAEAFLLKCAQECDSPAINSAHSFLELKQIELYLSFAVDVYELEEENGEALRL